MHLSTGPAITKNVLKFTALWTLMLMWTGSHKLKPVIVAATVIVLRAEHVLFVVRLHLGAAIVAHVGRRGRRRLVHILLFFVRVSREVDEARWETTWSTPGP